MIIHGDCLKDRDLKKVINKAKALAIKWGFPNEAEDFGQEAALAAFENKLVKFEWTFVEYLRKRFGDTRTVSGQLRSFTQRFSKSLDAPANQDDGETLNHDIIGSLERDPEPERLSVRIKGRNKEEELILYLIEQGYLKKEIAQMFDVSPSRISQIVTEMTLKPRLEHAKEIALSAEKRAGVIDVNWWVL